MALTLLLALTSMAQAQELTPGMEHDGGLSMNLRGGLALPAGELSGVATAGPTAGIGASYWLSDVVGIQADGAVDRYGRENAFGPLESEGPQVRLWHSSLGVALRFTSERTPGLTTVLGVGGGAAFFDTEPFLVPTASGPATFQFRETYLAPYGRARVDYELSERIDLSFGVRTNVIITNKSDTRVFEAATGDRVQRFDVAAAVPLTVGASIGL